MSLRKMIDDLINALGSGEPPAAVAIRGRLVKIAHLAETLESGQSSSEAEAEIQTLRKDLGAQRADFKREIEAANAELQRLRAKCAKKENQKKAKGKNLVEIQGTILKFLCKQDGPMGEASIAKKLKVRRAFLRHHLDVLKDANLVRYHGPPSTFNPRGPGGEELVTDHTDAWSIGREGRAYLASRNEL